MYQICFPLNYIVIMVLLLLSLFIISVTAGAAAQATELRKHEANDVKCSELGWLCISLVVESYGAWGKEAMESF